MNPLTATFGQTTIDLLKKVLVVALNNTYVTTAIILDNQKALIFQVRLYLHVPKFLPHPPDTSPDQIPAPIQVARSETLDMTSKGGF